jgi:hypothetical protein
MLCCVVQVGRQLEVQEQLLHGLEAQLKERERAVSGEHSALLDETSVAAAAAAASSTLMH